MSCFCIPDFRFEQFDAILPHFVFLSIPRLLSRSSFSETSFQISFWYSVSYILSTWRAHFNCLTHMYVTRSTLYTHRTALKLYRIIQTPPTWSRSNDFPMIFLSKGLLCSLLFKCIFSNYIFEENMCLQCVFNCSTSSTEIFLVLANYKTGSARLKIEMRTKTLVRLSVNVKCPLCCSDFNQN